MNPFHETIKRPGSNSPSNPSKRICKNLAAIDIRSIILLPEDVVWSLRKQDLRNYFLALQQYAINQLPIEYPSVLQSVQPTPAQLPLPLPPLLRLPIEIREIIYSFLLPPPSDPPILGPHPRQLHAKISFSQGFPPNLLRVNHLIRNEALPILYGAPTQVIFVTVDYNVWRHKTRRGDLVLSPVVTAAIRHLDLSIHLGSEKRHNKPDGVDAAVRLSEVKKGIKKLRKWLGSADLQTLVLSWQEPPQTYTWEQKKEVLDGVRGLRPNKVHAGEINWGLKWNKGRKFRFEVEYLKQLERGRQVA